jgi:thiol-disulfide isomerase/thioredoxin
VSPLAKSILKNDYAVTYATFLLHYYDSYRSKKHEKPLPVELYDFLQNVPVANPQILSSEDFGTFINRLEFMPLLREPVYELYRLHNEPAKSLVQYVFEELGTQKTPEDIRYLAIADSVKNPRQFSDMTQDKMDQLRKTFASENSKFAERYKEHADAYQKKYVDVLKPLSQYEMEVKSRQIRDSIYTNVLKLAPGIVADVITTRELNSLFNEMRQDGKEEAEKLLAASENSFQEEFLKEEARRLFYKKYPQDAVAAYELPNTEEAEAFKKIVEPFKGKYVLVDFWAIWCGPCIAAIKQSKDLREKYKDSKDVAFVFITSDKYSPLEWYSKLVEEQELAYTYRVTDTEYMYFRQLFAFNGIPHYVLINRSGWVMNQPVHSHDFELTLKKLLEEEGAAGEKL